MANHQHRADCRWSSIKLLLDFIPAMQSFAGIKSDKVNIQGINRLAAAERDVGIYFTECSV